MTPDLPPRGLLLGLLLSAALGHGLALLSLRRNRPAISRPLAAIAQLLLLAAIFPAASLALGFNDPATWLPTHTNQTLWLALWLALLVFLLAGSWWRSPGLGAVLPLLLASLLILILLLSEAPAARGLGLSGPARASFAALDAAALAFTLLATAALLGQTLERDVLGAARLPWRASAVLVTSAALVRTLQVGLGIYGWLMRPSLAPAWSLAQTWLITTWFVLLLASLALWRHWRFPLALGSVALMLLLLNLTLITSLPSPS